jgi:hypothetical protein
MHHLNIIKKKFFLINQNMEDFHPEKNLYIYHQNMEDFHPDYLAS